MSAPPEPLSPAFPPSAKGAADVFFHVGLGKAASTFLQYRFFPKLEGIRYIQRTQYQRAPERILNWLEESRSSQHAAPASDRSGAHTPIVLSREFDQQLERECTRFREALPDVRIQPVIVLRRQDGWLASQYRRHIKNGSPLPFEGFVDIDEDRGLWKRSDALFLPKLRFLESCFGYKPMVFYHEDLKANPEGFLRDMAQSIGARWPAAALDTQHMHSSYSEHQLKWMRKASRRWFPEPIAHGQTNWWQRRGRLLACYAVLYSSKLVPQPWTDPAPLIDPSRLEAVRAYYAEDWAACKAYSKSLMNH